MKGKLFKRSEEEVEKRCATCRYWDFPGTTYLTPEENTQSPGKFNPIVRGYCHCNPPVVVNKYTHLGETIHTGVFPVVLSTEWCGKHEAR